MGQSSAVTLRFARLGAVALVLALIAVIGTGRAQAATFVSGQQEIWPGKERGTGNNELFDPLMLGVDSTDGSVYIGDLAEDFSTARIRKFSKTGAFEAISQTLPAIPNGLTGIAVDSQRERFYVLESQEGTGALEGMQVAQKLVAFSTVPSGGELQKVTNGEVVIGGEAIVAPREMALDPSNGNLVILGKNAAGQIVIEEVDPQTGASVGRYTEVGNTINAGEETYAIAVDQEGVSYVLTGDFQETLRAYTLPAHLAGTLALSPVPGFAAAASAEEWPGEISGPGSKFVAAAPAGTGLGVGPQIAVASTSIGDVLYYKTIKFFLDGETAGQFYIHGYSVSGKATSVFYGGGSSAGSCDVQSKTASLAVGQGESLVVLDQGPLTGPGVLPFGPNVMRFGPGAGSSSCPVPAAALELKRGGAVVDTVQSGQTVTLDASKSELGGQTLTGMTWVVEGPGGTTFEESKAAPTTSIEHAFTTVGSYTVRLKLKTSAPTGLGNTVSAVPQKLTVTSGGGGTTEFPLAVSKSGTGTGTVTSSPTGIACGATCSAEFAEGVEVTLTPAADSGSEFVEWTGACTGTGACKVPMTAAKSVGVVFNLAGPPPPKFPLTVSKSGTGTGTVTSSPTGIACGATCSAEFAEGVEVTLTPAADSGSEFVEWTGACTGTGACTVPMAAAKSVGAAFKQKPAAPAEFSLTVTKAGGGSGSILCNGLACATRYLKGTKVTLTATADSGSTFTGWTGACSGTGACVVEINGPTAIGAGFDKQPVDTKPKETPKSTPPPPAAAKPTPKPTRTPAQILAEKRKAALKKCQKEHGKAKAQCIKKANQIGKPKKKQKKAAQELVAAFSWPL